MCDLGSADRIRDFRFDIFESVRRLGVRLRPAHVRWARALHPEVAPVIAHINMPLFDHLLRWSGFPNLCLPAQVSQGRPIVGTPAPGGAFVLRDRPSKLSIDELLSGVGPINSSVFESCSSTGDVQLDLESWSKVEKEFACGSLAGPFDSFAELESALGYGIDQMVVSRQFPIWEDHGAGVKVRNIADLKASRVNMSAGRSEAYIPDGLEGVAAILAIMIELGVPGALGAFLGFTSDFKGAYRQVPLDPADARFSVITMWDPIRCRPVLAFFRAQPFGSTLAPNNWAEVAFALTWIAGFLFAIALTTWVDDLTCVEPAGSVSSARSTWISLCEILGWALDLDKTPFPARKFKSLGVMVSLPDRSALSAVVRSLRFSTKPERLESLLDALQLILDRGTLRSGEASKVRGRLQFVSQTVSAGAGRAMVRLVGPSSSSSEKFLSSSSRCAIEWFLRCLPRFKDLVPVWDSPVRPLIISYSDATGPELGAPGLGIVVLPRLIARHGRIVGWDSNPSVDLPLAAAALAPEAVYIPSGIVTRGSSIVHLVSINSLEGYAPLAILSTFPEWFRALPCGAMPIWLHFIDNQAALFGLIGAGSCPSDHLSSLAAVLWDRLSCLPGGLCPTFFEWVASKANLSDPFSRMHLGDRIPKVDAWGRPIRLVPFVQPLEVVGPCRSFKRNSSQVGSSAAPESARKRCRGSALLPPSRR